MQLEVGEFDVGRLIEDVAATSDPLARANGNELVVRVDPKVGRMVSDEVRLRQAILNLMSNAAKFTSRGVINLSARRFWTEAGDWIEIEVKTPGSELRRRI